jgi:hypothetical protein
VIQGLGSVDSIKVLEPIVRFHSYAGYRYEQYSMPLESIIIFKLTNGLS